MGEKENAYVRLVQYILPLNLGKRFELVDVSDDKSGDEQVLHLHLDERDFPPGNRTDLSPNGFYEESRIDDFPIREYRTVLHIRRRRWLDSDGHTVSNNWNLTAKGTRISEEFALFLKEGLR
jgi:hypothetical protein